VLNKARNNFLGASYHTPTVAKLTFYLPELQKYQD